MLRYTKRNTISLWLALPVLGLLIVGFTAAGCGKQSAEAIVDRRDITAYLPVEGDVIAPASAVAEIKSPYAVPVAEIYVTVGQKVEAGDTLLLLTAPQNQVYYEQARAALARAQRNYEDARSRYSQELRLAQEQAQRAGTNVPDSSDPYMSDFSIPPGVRQEYDQAVVDAQLRMTHGLVPYQRAVTAAEEQLRAAEAGAKAAQIKTPISGIVLEMDVSVGSSPDPESDDPLIVVVNLDDLKVAAGVAEDRLTLLQPKNPANVTIKEVPNVEFSGSLDQIYSEKAGFLIGQRYVALIDFVNKDGQVKPDMQASVSIKVGEVQDVLAVPANAVSEADDHHVVQVREGGEWRQRVVEIGISDGQYTEIVSGLDEGDVVLTNP